MHGPVIFPLSQDDSILGTVTESACANGICTWTIVTVDVTKNVRSDHTFDDTYNYSDAVAGAVETYNLTSCNQLPVSGVFYQGIALYDQSGQQASPKWANNVTSGLDPQCGFDVTSTTTTVNLYHNPPPPPPPSLDVTINGPTEMQPNSQCFYSSTVSGGTGSYSYRWYQGGTLVGTESSVTVSSTGYVSSFLLTLDVSDSGGGNGSDQITVQITDSAPVCRFSPSGR